MNTNDNTNHGHELNVPPEFDRRLRARLIELADGLPDDERDAYLSTLKAGVVIREILTDVNGVQVVGVTEPVVAVVALDQLDCIATPNGIVAL